MPADDGSLSTSTLRIAFATSYDPESLGDFRGRIVGMVEGLRHHSESFYKLGPLVERHLLPILYGKTGYYRLLRGQKYYMRRDRMLIGSFGRQLKRKLERTDANVLLSPNTPGSQPIAYLECRQPIAIWTDATFAGTLDYYPNLLRRRMPAETLRDGFAHERAALERASLAIFKSSWAAKTAVDHYGIDPRKTVVVQGGPGLPTDVGPENVEDVIQQRPRERCRLLFIGADWNRKGGDVAVEVVRRLNGDGLPSDLTIVGVEPPKSRDLPDFVHVCGIYQKTDPQQLAKLQDLYRSAHFLVLPTRAEAMGMAFCEASAFALPSLAPDVGGVSSALCDGINGCLVPADADAQPYVDFIKAHFADPKVYRDLALSSFEMYRNHLNWDTATRIVAGHLRELL